MTLNNDIDDILEPILRILQVTLAANVSKHLATVYLVADRELISWGKTKLGKPILYEGPPIAQAVEYADKHTASLIKGMDEETRNQLRKVIADGIHNKRGVDGLARDLRLTFDDMSKYRSRMIARTETADALESAFMDRSTAMGVTGKEWVRGGNEDCEICQGNADAGAIPIKDLFPSGDLRPPGHPNCLCALAPVMLEGERGRTEWATPK